MKIPRLVAIASTVILFSSCGEDRTEDKSLLASAEAERFVSKTRLLSQEEVEGYRGKREATGLGSADYEMFAFTRSGINPADLVLGPLMKQMFQSDESDFGYLDAGSAIPNRSSSTDLTGGVKAVGPCYEKLVESSILGTVIVHFSYCVEAKVEKKYQGKGHYILNTYVEILDQWADNAFKIDPMYDLKVRVKAQKPENISNNDEEVVAKIEFAVHSFLDGPMGFDGRATDKFAVQGDKEVIETIQVHDFK